MTRRSPSASFFVAGGTLRPDAPSYVERRADAELLEALLNREFCYVLTSRQMGKSSLIVRAANRIEATGTRVAVLDLTALGQNLTLEQWYGGLLFQLGQRLGIEDELIRFWKERLDLGPLQRWFLTITSALLPRIAEPIVIFIDEIDVVRSLPFPTDEFFAGIRECHTRRATDPEMERITFCLSGVATPSDLIRDERTTPFNIGRRIELTDFRESEVEPLAEGFPADEAKASRLIQEVLSWTGGHPYLTQRFCQQLSESFKSGNTIAVNQLCEKLFLSPSARASDSNLTFVRDRLLKTDGDLTGLLELYRTVRKRKFVPAESQSPVLETLRLSGIVRAADGRLRVSNRIYEKIFDPKWIDFNLPVDELTRQRRAFRSGVLRASVVSALIITVLGALGGVAWFQWLRAEKEAAHNRRLTYASLTNLARFEYEGANIERSKELLNGLILMEGEPDPREGEWWILNKLTKTEKTAFPTEQQVYSSYLQKNSSDLLVGLVVRSAQQKKPEYRIGRISLNSAPETGVTTLFRTPAGINFNLIAFSPDGGFVATDDPQGTVTLSKIPEGSPLASFKSEPGKKVEDAKLTAISIAPDGKGLLTCNFSKELIYRSLSDGRILWKQLLPRNFSQRMSFSPDGKLVAVPDESATLSIFETATGKLVRELNHADLRFTNTCFLPDGGQLYASAENGMIPVFDVKTWKVGVTLIGHTSTTAVLTFSPDGKMIATGNADRTVKLWDTETGYVITTLRGHGGDVRTLNWSPDGQTLISGSVDKTVKVWDIREILQRTRPYPDIKTFLTTAIAPDGTILGFGFSENNQGRIVRFLGATERIEQTLEEPKTKGEKASRLFSASFSNDQRYLATAGTDAQIRIWNVATGKLIKVIGGPGNPERHEGNIYHVQFSPDDHLLVSGGIDKTIRLWDVATGKHIRKFEDNQVANYYRAVFSPDGKMLASACQDSSVKLWEVATGKCIHTLVGHTDRVRGIAFSPDGTRLATGGQDHQLRLWNVNNGQPIEKPQRSEHIRRISFSPNGNRIVTGSLNGEVVVWNSETMQEVVRLKEHTGEIFGIVFSADGKRLVTCSGEGRLLWWETGNPESK